MGLSALFGKLGSRRSRPDVHAAEFPFAHESRSRLRVLILGNCQAATVARLIQAMTGDIVPTTVEATPSFLHAMAQGGIDLERLLSEAELVLVCMIGEVMERIRLEHAAHAHKVRLFPPLNFTAYHPDCVYVQRRDGSHLSGPMADYHSSLVFWAWSQGWSLEEARKLFRAEAFDAAGFHDHEQSSRTVLLETAQAAGLRLEPLLDAWMRGGPWMHTINHPHLEPLADLTAALLRREGIEPMRALGSLVPDALAAFPVWPVYPEIAQRLGGEGSYAFKPLRSKATAARPILALGLDAMIHASYACYEAAGQGTLSCARVQSEAYSRLAAFRSPAQRGAPSGMQPHPYAGLADHHFWRRAMEEVPPSHVDPVINVRRPIAPHDKVATAGSCFAQHIARTLAGQGFHYFVAEGGEDLPAAQRLERQFGVYSARYGNVYTARQLAQLVERAYGRMEPADVAWQRADGRFVDPFRPQVEPAGFPSIEEVVAARQAHLAAVRRMLEQMEVFVFTLGLTEAWRCRSDGAVFPLAPGVAGGTWDPAQYEFVNFGVREVVADIRAAVAAIRLVNPGVRFVFTISPVPLIATYVHRHVLVSTAESKAILRAAIAEVAAADASVEYFPSFEIITGPHAQGRYFATDLRSVTDDGVAHVMRVFMKHYGGIAAAPAAAATVTDAAARHVAELEAEQRALNSIVCDEEAIERARRSPAAGSS